jgi:hypothetical protein
MLNPQLRHLYQSSFAPCAPLIAADEMALAQVEVAVAASTQGEGHLRGMVLGF